MKIKWYDWFNPIFYLCLGAKLLNDTLDRICLDKDEDSYWKKGENKCQKQ